jgi:hypothetical protein
MYDDDDDDDDRDSYLIYSIKNKKGVMNYEYVLINLRSSLSSFFTHSYHGDHH